MVRLVEERDRERDEVGESGEGEQGLPLGRRQLISAGLRFDKEKMWERNKKKTRGQNTGYFSIAFPKRYLYMFFQKHCLCSFCICA